MERDGGETTPASAADLIEQPLPVSRVDGPDPSIAGPRNGQIVNATAHGASQAGRRLERIGPFAAAGILGGLALVGAVVFGVAAHADLDGARGALTSGRTTLKRTDALLSSARAKLAAVETQSAEAEQALTGVDGQLAAAQADLARAQADVVDQGVSISALDTCLAGVEQALNQISLGDPSGAAATLQGVGAACQAAEPSTT